MTKNVKIRVFCHPIYFIQTMMQNPDILEENYIVNDLAYLSMNENVSHNYSDIYVEIRLQKGV